MADFLKDLGNWILGVSDAAGTEAGGFFMQEPVTSPRSDKIKQKQIRDKVKNQLSGNTNALKVFQLDEDIPDEERNRINNQINSLSPAERMKAELSYENAREAESQTYINAARATLSEARARYERGEAGYNEREREYREAIDQETGVYTTGDFLGIANVVSNASEAYDLYRISGESPAGAVLSTIFKGFNRGAIREKLASMPPEQRAEAIDEIVHKTAENSVLDVGYEDRLAFAEKIIEDKYTNKDIAVDSAMSAIDLLFGTEINALTKGAVAVAKPFARKFAGFGAEAAKNKKFMDFAFSNASERMAEEAVNSGIGQSIIKQQRLGNKKNLSTIEQAELNSERAATKFTMENDRESFDKAINLLNVAEDYFGWKKGSAMSPVEGGVLKGIIEGSDMTLKESFLKSSLAADRYVTNSLLSGTLKELKLKSPVDVVLDQPSLITLNDLAKSRKTINTENVKESLSSYGYFKTGASEAEKTEIAEATIKKLQESGYYFLDNRGRVKTSEVSNLKNKITNIDVSTGELHLKNPEQVVDLIELGKKEEAVDNLKNYFDRKSDVLSRKLDGDWSKYFNRQTQDKPFNTISQMNPIADNSGSARAQALKEAMDGEEFTSQGLDQTETILGNTLPTVGENKAPMSRAELVKNDLGDLAPEYMSDTTRAELEKEVVEQVRNLNGSNIDVSISGTEEVVKCTFSGHGNDGYKTIEEAREAITKYVDDLANIGVREPELKLVGADAKGNLEAVQEGVNYDKYYIQLEHRNDVTARYSVTGDLAEKAASIWDTTRLFRWVRDNVAKASTIYSDELIRPLISGLEKKSGFISKHFMQESEDFKKAFKRLSNREIDNLFNILYEQNKMAVEASRKGETFSGFSAMELKAKGVSDAGVEALSRLNTLNQMSWEMKNLYNARKLSSMGFEAVSTTSRGRMIGKEVKAGSLADEFEEGVITVFDSSSGQLVKVEAANANNYKFFKFASEGIGDVKYFVTPLDAKKSAINWHYDQVIGKIPAYTEMRIKEGVIFVESEGKVVGVTDSIKKAEDYIAGRDGYSWRRDSFAAREKTGGVTQEGVMRRRDGIDLIDVDVNDVFTNPLKSMNSAVENAARNIAIGPVIEQAKRDFVKLYGDNLIKGEFPRSINEIIGNDAKANAARSMFNFLEKMTGVSQGVAVDSGYKALLFSFGERLGKLAYESGGFLEWAAKTGEKAMYAAARRNPLAWSRQITSAMYIGLNPIRQFFLQGVQFANAVAVDPRSAHELLIQVSSVLMSKTKLSNIPERYKHFGELCERAGILTTESSVGYVSDAVDFAASMNNPFEKLVDIGSKGALFGEKGQQMFHAAALYNKYVREYGKEWFNVRKNFDKWIEEVRIMSGSQNPVERMPWEDGILGAVFQFAQSPWKMNQLLFNRQLPLSTRLGITANELLLFGGGTYGASLIYENLLGRGFGADIDEETNDLLKEGLFGHAVNKLFGVKMDTKNFAPTNYGDLVGFFGRAFGYNETEMATWMAGKWTQEESDAHRRRMQRDDSSIATKALRTLSIPAAGFAQHRIGPLIRDVMSITGRGNPYDPKDMADLLLDIGRMASGFNQATKAYIAYTTGRYLNSKGATLKEGLDNRAALGLLMGLNPEVTREEYSKAFMETAWRDGGERIGVSTAYRSCLQYLEKEYGKVDDLNNNAHFKRDLEIMKILATTWVDGSPERQEKLDKYMSKELIKDARGQKSDVYIVGSWIKRHAKKNAEEFSEALNKLKNKDPVKAEKVITALNKIANEKINKE